MYLQDMHDVLHESSNLEHSSLHYRRRPASGRSNPSGRQTLSVKVSGDHVQQDGAAGSTHTEYVLDVAGADGQSWEIAHRFRWSAHLLTINIAPIHDGRLSSWQSHDSTVRHHWSDLVGTMHMADGSTLLDVWSGHSAHGDMQ